MQRYSICLGLAQINMWKDVQLCWKTLGKIHHRSETHMSLSKAIYALDLILSHLLKNITPAILFFLLHYHSSPLHWITPISVQTCQYLFLQPQRIKHSIKLKRKTTSPATNTFLCFIFTVRPLESIIYTHHFLLLSSNFLLTHSYQDFISTSSSKTALVKVTNDLTLSHPVISFQLSSYSVCYSLLLETLSPLCAHPLLVFLLLPWLAFSISFAGFFLAPRLVNLCCPWASSLVRFSLSSLTPLGTSSDSCSLQAIHVLVDTKFTSQPRPLPECQGYTSNCLFNISTWEPNRYPMSFTHPN